MPIEILDDENPFLQGVMDGADEPRWWLEGASHPIEVLDRSRVQVLITSRELGRRYGEPAVAVLFPWGEGEVFHMISHYYLQRTELRSDRQRLGASAYYAEKGMAAPGGLGSLSVGDVESAATSSRLLANVVAAKKRAASEARTSRARARREGDRPMTDIAKDPIDGVRALLTEGLAVREARQSGPLTLIPLVGGRAAPPYLTAADRARRRHALDRRDGRRLGAAARPEERRDAAGAAPRRRAPRGRDAEPRAERDRARRSRARDGDPGLVRRAGALGLPGIGGGAVGRVLAPRRRWRTRNSAA